MMGVGMEREEKKRRNKEKKSERKQRDERKGFQVGKRKEIGKEQDKRMKGGNRENFVDNYRWLEALQALGKYAL